MQTQGGLKSLVLQNALNRRLLSLPHESGETKNGIKRYHLISVTDWIVLECAESNEMKRQTVPRRFEALRKTWTQNSEQGINPRGLLVGSEWIGRGPQLPGPRGKALLHVPTGSAREGTSAQHLRSPDSSPAKLLGRRVSESCCRITAGCPAWILFPEGFEHWP